MAVKDQYHNNIRRRFAALINPEYSGGFKSVCENVRENIEILV
jgi:hypothetical protein